jgi:nitroreductase
VNALEAIRKRRTVRRYTDRPVADEDLDTLLRLALLAPTGGGAQAWSLIVVREEEQRRALAELIIRGGAKYFETVRPPAEGRSAEEHARWAAEYAETALGTYRHVPVWIAGLRLKRGAFPDDPRHQHMERDADVISVAFAMENLYVAARAMGLGTAPTVFHWFLEDEFNALLGIDPAQGLETPLVTPLGYPEEFPVGLPPALAKIRRPWRTLVHDERWGNPRQS